MQRVCLAIAALLAAEPVFAASAAPTNLEARYQKLWGVSAAPAVQPAPSLAQDPALRLVAKSLQEHYGVKVIRADREQVDGKPVYRIIVMNPGGDFNDGYAVHTLVVDASTGALISQFRHEPAGYVLASPPDRTPRDDGTATAIRRETYLKL